MGQTIRVPAQALKLVEQPREGGLIEPGNIDLFAQPKVKNPDGTISTVDSIGINMDGREYLLPTVTPDGRHFINEARKRGIPEDQIGKAVADMAVEEFSKTGRHLGIFPDVASSTAYGEQLHNEYAAGKYDGPRLSVPLDQLQATEPERTWGDTAKDVAIGFAKGAGGTAVGLGELVHKVPGVTAAVDRLYGQPGLSEQAFQRADEAMTATNAPQMVGKGLELAAEMALPTKLVAAKVPTRAKAATKFQDVMHVAKNVPVKLDEAGNVALRIFDLSERGATMPTPVAKFLRRVTDPKKGPLTYGELRDFASNISRLSALEMQKVGHNKPLLAEVHKLRVALNKAAGEAASRVGKGEVYTSAMKEYARAAGGREAVTNATKGALKYAAPWIPGYALGRMMGVFD